MATRSRYRLFTAKEKLRTIEEAENIGNHALVIIVGHFAARKQGIQSLKKAVRLCER